MNLTKTLIFLVSLTIILFWMFGFVYKHRNYIDMCIERGIISVFKDNLSQHEYRVNLVGHKTSWMEKFLILHEINLLEFIKDIKTDNIHLGFTFETLRNCVFTYICICLFLHQYSIGYKNKFVKNYKKRKRLLNIWFFKLYGSFLKYVISVYSWWSKR